MHDACDLIKAAESRNDFAEVFCFSPPDLPATELWGNLVIPDVITTAGLCPGARIMKVPPEFPVKKFGRRTPPCHHPCGCVLFRDADISSPEGGEPPKFMVCLNRLCAARPK